MRENLPVHSFFTVTSRVCTLHLPSCIMPLFLYDRQKVQTINADKRDQT